MKIVKNGLVMGLVSTSVLGTVIAAGIHSDSVKATDSGVAMDSEITAYNVISANSTIGPGYYDLNRSRSARSSYAAVNTTAFINSVVPGAISGWNNYGVLPSVSIAQAILESGWGRSQLSTVANNLFGIKGDYLGQSVLMPTDEYIDGNWTVVNAQFRKYPSMATSIEDHGNFLASNSRYSNLLGLTDYRVVTKLLQADGYATAPTYAESLNEIIEQYGLNSYDQQVIQANLGSLDSASYSNNQISIRGWHASNKTSSLTYSFIILTDVATGRQYKQIPFQRTNRVDVANAYPDIINSLKSGFSLDIPVTNEMSGHTYKITSRYAQNADGSGSVVDYNFGKTIEVPKLASGSENRACLDDFSVSENHLNIRGWHASDLSVGRNNHYLIIMDATTNKEIQRIRTDTVDRNDVLNSYPNIYNSGNSGFSTTLTINSTLAGKNIYAISRYSASSDGNSDYIDYRFENKKISVPQSTVNHASLDKLKVDGSTIVLQGWHASDLATDKPYHYLFLMDAKTNKELKRIKVVNTIRNDVKRAYPYLYNSQNSGFETGFVIDQSLSGKKVYAMSRYSSSANGSTGYVDYKFSGQVMNVPTRNDSKASLDKVVQSGPSLLIQGWHASDLAVDRNYRYLFIMDKSTNRELKRFRLSSLSRPDVTRVYPNLYGTANSGFSLKISTQGLSGKKVYFITRYSGDLNGNTDFINYSFSNQVFTIK